MQAKYEQENHAKDTEQDRLLTGDHRLRCLNITVMGHQSFYPIKANDRKQLFMPNKPEYWR